jgi:NAD(P)-dependent dehydrogenase (short-subunit alcohol dehydrogenase family)
MDMLQRSKRLENKIALVTGIGSGIGRGIALMYARHGATVIGCNRSAPNAEATVKLAEAEGLTITNFSPCDLTKPEDVQRYIDYAGKKYGRIDILVNAGAINPPMEKIAKMEYKMYTDIMVGEVDLVFLACKAAWPYLLASGNASIINFASVAAFRGSLNMGIGVHSAGKAAVLALTRQLAVEGGPGIRANSIAPGLVVTTATISSGGAVGKIKEAIEARVPMKRLGQPEDIAMCAVYLGSDEACWVTGANFVVDGGALSN